MPVLSRVQQNEIFAIAQRHGLDAVDFDLRITRRSTRGDVEGFAHRPTGSRFDVSLSDADYWVEWWPKFYDGKTHTFAKTWSAVLQLADAWAKEVKKNHDAPSLWAEAHKARRLAGSAESTDESNNTPFTKEEIKELGPKLDEVEAFIEARQPLSNEQKAIVQSRFKYLLGAAKRGLGRVDWLNVFVGQVVSLFTEGVLASSLFKQVMDHASTVLTEVLKLGTKMIEEHLKS